MFCLTSTRVNLLFLTIIALAPAGAHSDIAASEAATFEESTLYGGVNAFSLAKSSSSFQPAYSGRRFLNSISEMRVIDCDPEANPENALTNVTRARENGYSAAAAERYHRAVREIQNQLRDQCLAIKSAKTDVDAIDVARRRDLLQVRAMKLEDGIFQGGSKSTASMAALLLLANVKD
jgi:hypothetical protein